MAAFHKVEVSLNANAVEVGIPSPQTVNVVVPLVGPQGPAGATGATGAVGPQGPQGPAGTGLETLTTQGDTLYRGASTGERLPIGTAGQVLKVVNGLPAWANESGAVTSVNGQTGAVTLTPADIDAAEANHSHNSADVLFQGLEILGAGNANTNGVYVYGGDLNGKDVYYKDKDTFVYWDGAAWVISYNADDIYSSAQNTTTPWQVTSWSVEAGQTSPAPSSWDRLTGDQWEAAVGQRINPTLRGDAAGKNVGTGANDVAAGNHTHSSATTTAAGFLSASDKTKLDGIAAGAEVNVNADWNATSGDAQILNKPTLGGAAALNVGTTTGTVAAGDDARLSDSRTPTAHAASHAAGTKASYNDQVAGMTENVFIRANNVGTAGNSITLTFDGVDDIDTVLAAWNAANTSNTAELVSGDSSQIPDNLEEISLSGGVAAGSDPFTNQNVSFGQVAAASLRAEIGGVDSFVITPQQNAILRIDNTDAAALALFINNDAGQALLGVRNGSDAFLQGSSSNFRMEQSGGGLADINVRNLISQDATTDAIATFDAQGNLTDDRTYTLPDADGILVLDSSLGTAATQDSTAFAPASHTHAASDITSGSFGNISHDGKVGSTAGLPVVTTTAGAVTTLALGTAGQVLTVNSGATGVEFAAASGGGVTTGSVDNAVIRANGTGGSTSQSSDLVIDDAVVAYAITGDASTDIITAVGHNYTANQAVRFQVLTGGSGLNNTTTYFVRDISGSTFKVSTTSGGAAVNFTTNITGGSVVAIQPSLTIRTVNTSFSITADAASDVITATGHTFVDGDPVVFPSLTGGAGINTTTRYFVRDAATNTFKVATTAGGAAVNITTDATAGSVEPYKVTILKTSYGGGAIFGGDGIASGIRSFIGGGLSATASGPDCAVLGGSGGTASGFGNSAVVGGQSNTASGFRSFVAGGSSSTASGQDAMIVGSNCTASGNPSYCFGVECTASAADSMALVYRAVADRNIVATAFGRLGTSAGTAQHIFSVLRGVTTTNSAVELLTGGAGGGSNRLTIPSGKVIAMLVNIVGVKSDGSAVAHYVRQYAIKNVGGTTSEVYAPVTIGTDNAASTSIAVEANDTNDALRINVTGIASETWRWVASVDAVEVAYGT